ncbi:MULTISPECIES: trans-aconitate 2-methyltransferase [unclassified Nocardia]|uniref:class I SAM-dependent methyltransferase n=1 Tax=unclassified Nocardia TaxID=2637762 RepID=UPI001CE40F93|nr:MULTISPECIES: methyltransferase domain-containing protein [unclassified Nocardia]
MTGLGSGGRADAARLAGIADTMDGYTLSLVESLGMAPEAHVIDIGAGTGGVAAALADRYPAARVVALDRDTSIIDPAVRARPNIDVVSADITDWATTRRFDLVHARFVLIHLPDRDTVLARLRDLLAPGGLLVLTEPYQLDDSTAPDPAVGRVLAAYRSFAARTGTSFTWIRSAPTLFTELGFTGIDVRTRAGRLGGGPEDRWSNLIRPVADRLEVAAEDLDRFYEIAGSPGWHDIPQLIVTVVGRRPD